MIIVSMNPLMRQQLSKQNMGNTPWTMRNRKGKLQKDRKYQKSNIHLPRKETRDAHGKNEPSGRKRMA
jgi:hypothetical protein